jgi:hypothetical protein
VTSDDDEQPGAPVFMGAASGLGPGHPLALGCTVSRLMGGRPLLLLRALEHHSWH